MRKAPLPILNLLQNPQGWFIIRLENRRILECPTVAQSETYKALSLLTDYRLSPIGVEDSLSVYLRLRLLSMYVKAANTTNKSVSTSKVFIATSFPFPERLTNSIIHELLLPYHDSCFPVQDGTAYIST